MTVVIEDVNFDLVFGEKSEDPCENTQHRDGSFYTKFHDGPGEWYLTFECPYCSDTGTKLYCNMFYITGSLGLFTMKCAVCKVADIPFIDFVVNWARKNF